MQNKNTKDKAKTNVIISCLRFLIIISAAVIYISLNKLTIQIAIRLLTAYIIIELIFQSYLIRKEKRIPHVIFFVFQSGFLTTAVLYCMNKPELDLYFCIGITLFVALFLKLFFPVIYRKKIDKIDY